MSVAPLRIAVIGANGAIGTALLQQYLQAQAPAQAPATAWGLGQGSPSALPVWWRVRWLR